MEKTCKTCWHGIWSSTVESYVCTNPDGIYQQPVADDRTCNRWKPEKENEKPKPERKLYAVVDQPFNQYKNIKFQIAIEDEYGYEVCYYLVFYRNGEIAMLKDVKTCLKEKGYDPNNFEFEFNENGSIKIKDLSLNGYDKMDKRK